jgi:hypothetical protein
MTLPLFDYARHRGNEHKIGQLNPLGRYGIPQGAFSCISFLHRYNLIVLFFCYSIEPAAVALFLASGEFIYLYIARSLSLSYIVTSLDDASYVNGQNWAVDGGLSSSMPYVRGRTS